MTSKSVAKSSSKFGPAIRWGFLSAGRICNDFAQAMKITNGHERTAIAARSIKSAEQFAEKHGFKRAYGSYEELCKDNEIDIIYVGSIHWYHKEHVLMALENNKHVLIEKPITCSYKDTKDLIEIARSKNLFLSEGMWTRYFPAVRRVRELIQNNAIGNVQTIMSDFAFNAEDSGDIFPNSPIYDPKIGGGCLYLAGVYPLATVPMIYGSGKPEKISAVADIENGMDWGGCASIKYSNHRMAQVHYGFKVETAEETTFCGSKGRIKILGPGHCPESIQIEKKGEGRGNVETTTLDFPLPEETDEISKSGGFFYPNSIGFTYEIEHIGECLRSGLLESPEYNHAEILRVSAMVEEIHVITGRIDKPSQNYENESFPAFIVDDDKTKTSFDSNKVVVSS